MKVRQTIFNQSTFSFSRIALCRAFVQLARKVLAVTFHSREILNHTNLQDFPHCFSAWETVLFETIVFCSNISTRLLATELARGKVGKQKQGFRSKQQISPSTLLAASSKMENRIPVVSKIFCSGTPTMLMIRRRPIVVNGGGFVVTDLSHNVVFTVDGCGILGSKGEIMVKDGEGEPILFISKKGGIVQALSTRNKWNGYLMDYQGKNKLVFSLTDPKSCIAQGAPIIIHIEPKRHCKNWDFEIGGSFADRDCTIVDCTRKIVAQMSRKELIGGKDFYHVEVRSGYDQAFIIGVMAILDNIHGESTRC